MPEDLMMLMSPKQTRDEDFIVQAREIIACRVLAQLLVAEGRAFATMSSVDTDAAIADLVAIMERLAALPAGWLS